MDGGFANRGSMEAMAKKGIETSGSLIDPQERSATAIKAMGIDPAFRSEILYLGSGQQ